MNLFKCHYYHIISKITLCSFIFIIFLLIIEKLIMASSIDYKQSISERSLSYLFSILETERLFSIILFVFIFGLSFSNNQDSYRAFLIISGISRNKYFITKCITLIIILTSYIAIELISSLIICLVFKIEIEITFLNNYLSLFLLILYYSLISILLVQIYNNYYLTILPFIIYILINSLEVKTRFISYIILIIKEDGNIYNGYLYSMFLVLLLFIINLLFYNLRDLPSV